MNKRAKIAGGHQAPARVPRAAHAEPAENGRPAENSTRAEIATPFAAR